MSTETNTSTPSITLSHMQDDGSIVLHLHQEDSADWSAVVWPNGSGHEFCPDGSSEPQTRDLSPEARRFGLRAIIASLPNSPVSFGSAEHRQRVEALLAGAAHLGLTPQMQYETGVTCVTPRGIGPEDYETRRAARDFGRLRAVIEDMAAAGYPACGYAAADYWSAYHALQRVLHGRAP